METTPQRQFKVDLDFRKGASFSPSVTASTQQEAEQQAIKLARGCGFDAPLKKCTTREIPA